MTIILGGGPASPPAAPAGQRAEGAIVDVTAATFMREVMEASLNIPVIVDFWAPWCGPCKQLTPMLEKLVRQAGGKVKLAKVNIDQEQAIAAQLRVQSVPTVYAFVGGRPVDAFTGALPESQVRQFIERLAGGGLDHSAEQALAEAKAALAEGNTAEAAEIFGALMEHEPSPAALAGLGRCWLAEGKTAQVKALLDGVQQDWRNHAEITGLQAAFALLEEAGGDSDLTALQAKVAARPEDHQARCGLASALFGAGKAEEAMEHLLESIRKDRAWNEEAARKKLIQFFEALGPSHPAVASARRKLSSILFS